VIVINDQVVPLPPIPFFTKKESRKRKMTYKTEVKRIISYFKKLNLHEILGQHESSEIVFMMDSGYDAKELQNFILKQGWDLIASLKKTRTLLRSTKPKKWINIHQYFCDGRRFSWKSVRIKTYSGKNKRWQHHKIKQREGFLKGVHRKMQLVCSKRTHDKKNKYIACSNLKVDVKSILFGYKKRWLIELFHRDIKSYLGFEHAGVRKFNSLNSHVHWVYCSYNILKEMNPDGTGIKEAQIILERKMKKRENKKVLQVLTQINGQEKVKSLCRTVIQKLDALEAA
jgi:hypothetical protein